ncbi:hypothetical protein HN51_056724 [Arachis hypogaea]|uniref:Uncharacterized protein n=1 Tax=Arachis hypogaea TaxID=3818 RepID=A0A444XV33_ARAHY|nr:uncharacterized protein LOC110266982 [Arachis ipaensis]XP_025679189.1 uncharacterized protein LOC112779155 [Arachis hypogaea]QHN79648.1 uncharacterized protein DS421_19g671780 [Arachis hypogaea]RYQ93592.1 hypothetical protein Ahy_B09g099854 [Arachis hypogaea]
MQLPSIHNNLETAIISLQKKNPNYVFTNSIYSFCKWGVLVIAFLATFRTITNILIIRFSQTAPSLSSILDDDDFSDIDEDDVVSVSSSNSDPEDESEEDTAKHRDGEYFRVRGTSNDDGGFLRRRSIGDLFSLAEIANSKSVVKLWDTIGLGLRLGFDNSDCSDDESVYDHNEEPGTCSVASGNPPAPVMSCASASPAVVVLGGESASGNLAVRLWDSRIRKRSPAVVAEWGPTSDGVDKAYVRDDGRYVLRVGDIRNVKLPLANVKASYIDNTWWPNSFHLLLPPI